MIRLAILFLLSGCATPYAEIGLGYKLPTTHYSVYGRSPTAHLELGLEWDRGFSCGYHHFSHLRDGSPFNDRPETYMDTLVCKKRWGGR